MLQGKFHIAFATTDLKRIKAFYGGLLGCPEGRSAKNWVDYNFFGHQLTIQEVPRHERVQRVFNPKSNVPNDHWGIVLDLDDWKAMLAGARGLFHLWTDKRVLDPATFKSALQDNP